YRQGSLAQGLAIYEKSFEPLWPAELVQSYYGLMKETGGLRQYLDESRAALERNPDDLRAAARIFYYHQQLGRLDAARQYLSDYRLKKEERGGAWSAEELWTLARLNEEIHAYSEAARYYYALHNAPSTPRMADAQERALGGIVDILLTAPEQPLRIGA